MFKLDTTKLGRYRLDREQILWAYNGMDCMLTEEIRQALAKRMKDHAVTYNFERAMLGPAMAMMRRGLKVDLAKRDAALAELYPLIRAIGGMVRHDGKWEILDKMSLLQRLAIAVQGKPINYNSPKQLKELFYDRLGIPPIYDRKKGTATCNAEALEKIRDNYPRGEPFARAIIRLRDLHKTVDVLEKGLDADNRIRCSYNVAGTETGRWSSSTSVFNTGTNLQNITMKLRDMFVPDEGYTMYYADLEQAESRAVAYLAQDENYINACESGDLHVTVSCMVFGIQPEEARDNYYRHFSYRDMSKRAGHGTNYGLTPHSLARHMHIEVKQAYRFNVLYLGGEMTLKQAEKLELLDLPHEKQGDLVIFPGAFPGIKRWQEDTATIIQTEGKITTPLGRCRTFWGRPGDSATIREAIAFAPQSVVGDVLNIGLWRLWNELESNEHQILGQVHDAVIGQVKSELVDEYRSRIVDCLTNTIAVGKRSMTIPASIYFGSNWKEASDH